MINDLLAEASEAMEKAIKSLQSDLSGMRTGRASSDLVTKLLVNYHGVPTQLQQLALVSVPESQLITIRPYDPSAIKEIERTILQSDLGLTPNNDGKLIRLQVPTLTQERRRELVKTVTRRVEEAKVSIRNTRRACLEDMKSFEKEKMISEDEFYHGRDEAQKLTDKYIKRVDDIGAAKEKELLEV